MSTLGKSDVHMPGVGDGASGHPTFWNTHETREFGPFPDGGGYPVGFLKWAYATMTRGIHGYPNASEVVHLCSGSVEVGITVDIRPQTHPTILADARNTGLPPESVRWVMADPPYSEDYAQNLYGTGLHYPKPSELLREASRILAPGGMVGILHFQVPMNPPSLRLVSVYGVTQGAGYNIRAWTVYEKSPEGFDL